MPVARCHGCSYVILPIVVTCTRPVKPMPCLEILEKSLIAEKGQAARTNSAGVGLARCHTSNGIRVIFPNLPEARAVFHLHSYFALHTSRPDTSGPESLPLHCTAARGNAGESRGLLPVTHQWEAVLVDGFFPLHQLSANRIQSQPSSLSTPTVQAQNDDGHGATGTYVQMLVHQSLMVLHGAALPRLPLSARSDPR
jgi:hypothetical protein